VELRRPIEPGHIPRITTTIARGELGRKISGSVQWLVDISHKLGVGVGGGVALKQDEVAP